MTSFEEIINRDGQLIYTNVGDSMQPLIRQDRDLLIIEKSEGRLKKYDVPLYKRDSGQYVLHRILKVRKDDYVICGDNRYCKEYGLNVKLARPSYIYGASSLDDDRVWAQFIANAVRGEDILLKSNGAAKRSFCYVSDTASALLYILLNGENAFPYNISNEKSDVTIRGFAKKACEVFPEKHMKLAFQNPEDEKEPEELKTPLTQIPEILDSTKLRALGWQPRVDLAEGIKRSVEILTE